MGNYFKGMLTGKKENSDVMTSYFKNKKGKVFQNQQVNTMTMTRQFEKSAMYPIYDMCCQKELSRSNRISKLCFVRCYNDGVKTDSAEIVTPQEVGII